ncbi:MAG: FAD-dependent oxidoreductase [candidate division WOR-3 bacterium]|nr:MAG: FAD-dependent oxidoreductase [candidate division WOR-3 bacterium]
MTSRMPSIQVLRRAIEQGRASLSVPGRRTRFKVRPVRTSSCQVACPAGVNVKAYVGLIGARDFDRALEVVMETNPLPGICGRVCTHPCEAECRRAEVDAPVAIRLLKRFIADYALKRGQLPPGTEGPKREQRVAVVGSGPAGITAANDLARLGYAVTVFEALNKPGGMLRVGIPSFRLPHDIIDHEIGSVARLGVSIQTSARIDDPVALLRRDFSAVFYAVGAHRGIGLGLELEDKLRGVVDCTDFLRNASLGRGRRIKGKVVVIGGGNSAIDSARVALRLGAQEVEVLYRRTRKEMPAYDEEVEDAIKEGIKFQFLVRPLELLQERGRVTGLACLRTRLGKLDSSGRRRPEPIPGSEFVVPAALIIKAIGQRPDTGSLADSGIQLSKYDTVPAHQQNCSTAVPGLFAGGDVVTGPGTVIDAIAAGHRAASSIHTWLQKHRLPGSPARGRFGYEPEIVMPSITAVTAERAEPVKVSRRSLRTFAEVEHSLTESQAVTEAGRCLRCGPCSECVQCHFVCPRRQVALSLPGEEDEVLLRVPDMEQAFGDLRRPSTVDILRPNAKPVRLLATPVLAWVDPKLCRACGECIEACPHEALSLVAWRSGLEVAQVDVSRCRGCGNCLTVCPSGAIYDRPPVEAVHGE